ncbi:AsmA family protein [Thiomicrospira microaerophila]|uniref:AsmA family protein n=1 Tax=Thiomicrospira microaerophila TaxID=406020 RepID=UPI0005C933F0|nr:AsmA family protein [Thiomicrospira microaerophila]
MANGLKRLFKIVLIVAVSVPLFLLIGFVLAISFMDFNKYKPMIEQEISAKTGLELKIDGDLNAGVWPLQLSIASSQLQAADADAGAGAGAGADSSPVLAFDQLNLQLSYRDLLFNRKLQLTSVEWIKPRLVLTRQQDGQVNWRKQAQNDTDWHYRQVAQTTQTAEKQQALAAILAPIAQLVAQYDLKLTRFKIVDGELIWRDLSAHQAFDISGLQLDATPIQLAEPMALKLDAQVKNADNQQTFDIKFEGQVVLANNLEHLLLQQVRASLAMQWPPETQRVAQHLTFTLKQLDWSLSQGHWQLDGFSLDTEAMAFSLDAKAHPQGEDNEQSKDSEQSLQVSLNIERANPRAGMRLLGMTPLNFVEQRALTDLKGTLKAQWANQAWSLESIALQLDDTQIQGYFSYRIIEQLPSYQFDLHLDQLNMDFYALRAAAAVESEKGEAISESTSEATSESTYLPIAIPVTTLRESQVKGQLDIGQLQAWQTKLTQVKMGLNSNYGQLVLAPFDAKLYAGEWLSQLQVDVNHDAPKYQLKGRMMQVETQDFLTDLVDYSALSGQLSSRFDLRTQGSNLEAIKYHLNGLFSAELNKGAYRSLDINKLLSGQASQPGDATQFDQLQVKGEAINGIYHIQQADLRSERFSARAFGRVHIPRAMIDSQLQFTYQQPPANLAMLQGVQLPIKLTGPIAEPEWQVELAQLLSPDNLQRLLRFLR